MSINLYGRSFFMLLSHEFGIVQVVSDELFKGYQPNAYNCISVEDNAIIEVLQPLSIMKLTLLRLIVQNLD